MKAVDALLRFTPIEVRELGAQPGPSFHSTRRFEMSDGATTATTATTPTTTCVSSDSESLKVTDMTGIDREMLAIGRPDHCGGVTAKLSASSAIVRSWLPKVQSCPSPG